jgi:hypothetical protein
MKWIKASERLPDDAKDYGSIMWFPDTTIIRRIDNKSIMRDLSAFGDYGKKWGLEKFEWLDESPSKEAESKQSAEQILNKIDADTDDYGGEDYVSRSVALKAMEQYANQG